MKRLVIGILAHVDSGKTTLSEGILYKTGKIRKLGRVDHKNTFLDIHSLERKRGITIFSKQAHIKFKDMEFTLLDTPGHTDFSAETERTLQVLDYAILLINGAEGIQSHTETLWRLLKRYNVPVFIFLNKMDFSMISKSQLISELKKHLSENIVDFEDDYYEDIALCDESLMQMYLETENISDKIIAEFINKRKIFPCISGSALKMQGIETLLDIIEKYTLFSEYKNNFSATVFKISEDEQGNRLTHMKITGGNLKVKSTINGKDTEGNEWSEKINQIRIYSGSKFTALDTAESGMICTVTGLTKTFSGEGLGEEKNSKLPILEPILSYKVETDSETDIHNLLFKLRHIEEEIPELNLMWREQTKEIYVRLMGEIQLDIIKNIVLERYGINISFSHGRIAYKETISEKCEGVGHYEPLRHYAEVHLLLEPAKSGSGLEFYSICSEDFLDRNWQRLILTHLKEKTHIGVLTGSPITDMKITLVSGKAHLKHTEGGDFRQAVYRAVRQGLRQAKSVILEPYCNFSLELPSEFLGRAIADLETMDAIFSAPEFISDKTVINGVIPAETIKDYPRTLAGYTKGMGRFIYFLDGYRPCRNPEKVIEEIGYDCDGDIENTADSVFCKNGAGVIVKWNEVKNHMHLESFLKPKKSETVSDSHISYSKKVYSGSLEEDKELIEIFERTYGKIKHMDVPNPLKTEHNSDYKNYKSADIPKGEEYLLIDGYNIIFSWEELKKQAVQSLDLARNTLINMMCNYQGVKKCNLILVFDAYKVKGQKREVEKINNINVVYTKEAETADAYIEKTTHELSKNNRIRVATSDGLEQLIILGNGAYRMSASEFYAEFKEVERQIDEFIQKNKLKTNNLKKILRNLDE